MARADAPNDIIVSQNALSTTAEEILEFNATRRRAVVQNLEASGGVVVYIGHTSSVSSSNGFALAGQQSVEITTRAAVYAIAASATPSISILEEYD